MNRMITNAFRIDVDRSENNTIWYTVYAGNELVETYRNIDSAAYMIRRLVQADRDGELHSEIEKYYKSLEAL